MTVHPFPTTPERTVVLNVGTLRQLIDAVDRLETLERLCEEWQVARNDAASDLALADELHHLTGGHR